MKFLLKSLMMGVSIAVLFLIVVAVLAEIVKFLDHLGVPYVLGFLFLIIAAVSGTLHYLYGRRE